MPTYAMLVRLTAEGVRALRERPSSIAEALDELGKFGVRVAAKYALLGPYDLLCLFEAPDNESAVRAAVELGSRGLMETTTMAAVPFEELARRLGG